jgi:acyl carrier protein
MAVQDADTVRETVRGTLLKFAPVKPEALTRETILVADMAYHSLAIMEVIFTLEEELGVELIDDGTTGQISTVGDVEDYVIKVMAQA